MVSYITRSALRDRTRDLREGRRAQLQKATSSTNSTFLSHSSKDADLVEGASQLLAEYGASVYVDRVDNSLPPYTSKETALALKNRIADCKKFVLLASENSKDSRWVPWELGIADSIKGLENIALLAAVDEHASKTWPSWEYMGLYRHLVWGNLQGYPKPLWMVLDKEQNTARSLEDWLKA